MLEFRLSAMTESEKRVVLSRGKSDFTSTMRKAERIIDTVRYGGDAALRSFAKRLDGYTGKNLSVPLDDIRRSAAEVSREVIDALKFSRRRIERFHALQRLDEFEFTDRTGVFGQKVVPLDRVGVYVPGGTARYVSSVLMACIPAKVAGVKEIAICTPVRGKKVPREILAAANLCGVLEVHPVGGAHAIAALAYGTKSIPRVQKIVGPGGSFVSAAKLLVRNDCEIDFLAGPSEILVIADSKADSGLIARDMLAQLEHDPMARAVLVTTSPALAEDTKNQLGQLMAKTQRSSIASQASADGAIFIVAESLKRAVEFSNEYAPEHLSIDCQGAEVIMAKIMSAGSVFLGKQSSVVFGDYCSGTNHILPTKSSALMKSSLTVYDFLKVVPYQNISPRGAAKFSKVVDILARIEGLPAHAEAALARARKGALR